MQFIHSKNYVHGDIKPENFALNIKNSSILKIFGKYAANLCLLFLFEGKAYRSTFKIPLLLFIEIMWLQREKKFIATDQ